MIVRLTRRQHERLGALVKELVGDPRRRDAVLEWMMRDVSESSGRRIDIAMPAVAWKIVWEMLFDHCFDSRGMRVGGIRSTDLNAMKSVRASLNVREAHPALSGVGAIGLVSEVVPAWRLADVRGGFRYSPYPVLGQPFVVLAPELRQVRYQRVTQWVGAKRSPDRPLLDEREHWRFT